MGRAREAGCLNETLVLLNMIIDFALPTLSLSLPPLRLQLVLSTFSPIHFQFDFGLITHNIFVVSHFLVAVPLLSLPPLSLLLALLFLVMIVVVVVTSGTSKRQRRRRRR